MEGEWLLQRENGDVTEVMFNGGSMVMLQRRLV